MISGKHYAALDSLQTKSGKMTIPPSQPLMAQSIKKMHVNLSVLAKIASSTGGNSYICERNRESECSPQRIGRYNFKQKDIWMHKFLFHLIL